MRRKKILEALVCAAMLTISGAIDSGCVMFDNFGRFAEVPERPEVDAGPDAGADEDAGTTDAGRDDAGADDAGADDAGPSDAGLDDAGADDAGAPDAGATDGGPPGCDVTHVCVGPTPDGWSGPVAAPEGTSALPCPSGYPTSERVVTRNLIAPAATCNCGCYVTSSECVLQVDGISTWIPSMSCASPPRSGACLEAQLGSTCGTTPSESVPTPSWGAYARLCGGAVEADTCDGGGRCLPRTERLCIFQEGEHTCPASFPQRTVYYQGVRDNRSCSACNCYVTGGCEIKLEICGVSFYDVTLTTDGGEEFCLNRGEDDGVTHFSTAFTTSPICHASGGVPQGSATPEMPLTVCCMP